MRIRIRTVALALLLVSGCVALTARIPDALRSLLCEDTTALEVPSPRQQHTVRVFERNCGATTAFVTYVDLRAIQWWTFGRSEEILRYRGRPSINPIWPNDGLLVLEYSCDMELAGMRDSWDGVTILYRKRDPAPDDPCGAVGLITLINRSKSELEFRVLSESGSVLRTVTLRPRNLAIADIYGIPGPTVRVIATQSDGEIVFDQAYRWTETDQLNSLKVVVPS